MPTNVVWRFGLINFQQAGILYGRSEEDQRQSPDWGCTGHPANGADTFTGAIHLMDQVRLPIYILFYPPHVPAAYHSSGGRSSCPHPVHRYCNDSITSTDPHPGFTTNSVAYFMGRSIRNVCRTSKAMIWRGSLNT